MKLKKYYWKVVLRDDNEGKFYSFFISGKAKLTYRLGKVTKHKFNNGIFCFETRDQARRFRGGRSYGIAILKVEVTGKLVPAPIYADYYYLEYHGHIENAFCKFPRGTIAFTAIKPIQIVR